MRKMQLALPMLAAMVLAGFAGVSPAAARDCGFGGIRFLCAV